MRRRVRAEPFANEAVSLLLHGHVEDMLPLQERIRSARENDRSDRGDDVRAGGMVSGTADRDDPLRAHHQHKRQARQQEAQDLPILERRRVDQIRRAHGKEDRTRAECETGSATAPIANGGGSAGVQTSKSHPP